MMITDDSVALISGGASGLGAASAHRIIADGGRVVLLDLPSSGGAALAEELGEAATFAPGDVTSEKDVQAAVQQAGELGELRVVVTCAGVATPGRILGKQGMLPLAEYRRVVEINLIGTFAVLEAAAEAMAGNEPRDGDRGVVVMTASVAAYDGQIGQAAYSSSKGGVASLTLPAARDLARSAIRVMTIAPGVFETPMMAGLGDDVRASLEALVPHPARLGRPEEYADLVAHIVANPLLNGEVIRLDGALRMPPR
ncbi:SDR family NAD(P)-dependent oxidoreductase [Ruania alba]|uniref:NAD(P)-dependent dehydrogenase, short-chain alcohol dehydrogenase family n=1 Tax=Ruania alba TaxID=648782 RepID=A0A1H5MX65_9MICO|nr:SDR family NAD(P)-dependent oxidoreductase [Ruania alba]SEE93221.1 NAD(P)-dependent dehydrogenase, short-chain alcohol dehydrogenase family [Ruania alba]